MDISLLLNVFLHLDVYLGELIKQYSTGIYIIIFLVVFVETGLVIMPFLPGDSLLFAVGSFAALGSLILYFSLAILSVAAILGDSVNYFVGQRFGRKIFKKNRRFLDVKHLEMTERFYQKHGAKTIILARFAPFIRTFAPFVAGVGNMNYFKFFFYNIIGGLAWVFLFVLSGYWFGNIPFVKDNFSIFILGIIFVSLLPLIINVINHYLGKK